MPVGYENHHAEPVGTGSFSRRIPLDFTQKLKEATDAITLGRRHLWLASEGFSLSAANPDVQELPATLYHLVATSLVYAA